MSPPLYQVADILQWREPLVRDLAWALLSPPLLAPHDRDIRWLDAAWSRRAYEAYQGRLQALDRQPEPLRRFLAGRPDQRLGSHFEGLLA